MKNIKTFEQHISSDKDRLIELIKKHITKIIPLQPGFRDDGDDKYIEISNYKESDAHTKCECIDMLDTDTVFVQTYYVEDDGELNIDQDSKPYDIEYEDLDIEVLEKIVELILNGDHIYDISNIE